MWYRIKMNAIIGVLVGATLTIGVACDSSLSSPLTTSESQASESRAVFDRGPEMSTVEFLRHNVALLKTTILDPARTAAYQGYMSDGLESRRVSPSEMLKEFERVLRLRFGGSADGVAGGGGCGGSTPVPPDGVLGEEQCQLEIDGKGNVHYFEVEEELSIWCTTETIPWGTDAYRLTLDGQWQLLTHPGETLIDEGELEADEFFEYFVNDFELGSLTANDSVKVTLECDHTGQENFGSETLMDNTWILETIGPSS